jgi:hypothetical protein
VSSAAFAAAELDCRRAATPNSAREQTPAADWRASCGGLCRGLPPGAGCVIARALATLRRRSEVGASSEVRQHEV